MPPRPSTSLLLTAALVLGLVPGAGSWAQVAAGGGGRALDANQRAGSGGTNTLENQVDYRVRNELLTRNVGGVLGFQDELGYTSSGAFQDALGSDELFQFRTQSVRSDVSRVNTPFARRGALEAGNVVFNSFATPEASGFNRSTVVQGGVFGVNPTATNPAATGLDSQRFTNPLDSPGTTTLGVLAVPDGGALAVSVDPLRGVVRRNLPPRRSSPGAANEPIPLPGVAQRLQLGFGDNTARATALGRGDGFQLGQLQGIVSGQLRGVPGHGDPQSVRDRVAEARERIFGVQAAEPTPDAKPVDNAYTRLLEQIKDDVQGNQKSGDDAQDDRTDLRPEWMKQLTAPPESRIEAAERRMAERLESIRTGVQRDDKEARARTQGTPDPAGSVAAREQAAADLSELLDRLDYDVRLETLVAEREGRTAKLYQSAEADLAGGRFINAERTYRQIRLEDAENPLGRAGLIHAQLGAGMMRAAAFNLRGLFEIHPELIATRYSERLLPPGDRMVWLQNELQRSIDAAGASGQAGLMMAYLGHQVESRQLVRYGLAVAREADPDDALLPLLERIWLDVPGAPGPDTSPLAPATK